MTDKTIGLKLHNQQLNQEIIESLQEALLILMKEKNFKKITITELCSKAGVSRMAFYGNFKNKDEIITAIVTHSNNQIIKEIGSPFRTNVSEEWYYHLFEIIDQNTNFLKIIFNAQFKYRYLSMINELVLRNQPSSKESYYRIIWAGGIVNSIIYWIDHDKKESIKEIASFCYHSLNQWIIVK